MSASKSRPGRRRRVEIAPGVTYREWINVRRRTECACRKDGIACQLNTGDGILSFRFGLNFTRDALLSFGPWKAAMMFEMVARLHNGLRELGGERYAHVAPITAQGLVEQVLRDRGTLQ